MARQCNAVFYIAQRFADLAQDVAHVGLHQRTACVEHGAVLLVHDLDVQTVGGFLQLNLRAKLGQFGIALDQLGELLLQRIQPRSLLARLGFLRHLRAHHLGSALGVTAVHLAKGLAQIAPATGQDAAAVAGARSTHE